VFPSIAKKLLVRWTHQSGKVVSEKMVRFWVSLFNANIEAEGHGGLDARAC
jgi:hypothetical protein